MPRRVPFVVDVSESTFVYLDRLMERASPSAAAAARPPAQEDECVMVAALRLLTLQVRAGLLVSCSQVMSAESPVVLLLSKKVSRARNLQILFRLSSLGTDLRY